MMIILKNIVLAVCLLYAINFVVNSAGILIPINYYTIACVAIFGFPALVGLVIMQKLL